MHNIKLIIQYDGTSCHGWQVQPDVLTVQGILLDCLRKVIGEKVETSAGARTDSGVHARCQVANFKTTSSIHPKKLALALNSLLPKDIVIAKASYVPDSFNARYSARARKYRYTILNRTFRSPFDLRYCYFFPREIDVNSMNRAARFLVGLHDFSSFQASFGKRENSTRTIENIKLFSRAGFIYMDIQASGFLTHMVRIIIGTLLNAGTGKIPPEDVKRILEAEDREKAGPTLPAKGLCLMKILY